VLLAQGAGLSNPHWWTCFLNCILQCMVHTVPLVLKLRKADHPDPCPRKESTTSISMTLFCIIFSPFLPVFYFNWDSIGASVGFCCFCSLKLHVDESIRLSGSAFYPESFVNHLKCMFILPNFKYCFAYISLLLPCIAS
jgi:ubiquitin carboxyl-terminal hydrolase 36/42